jgi:ribonuclease E
MVDETEKKPRRRAASRPAGPATEELPITAPVKKPAKKAAKKATKKTEGAPVESQSNDSAPQETASVKKPALPLFQVAEDAPAAPKKISAPVKGKGRSTKKATVAVVAKTENAESTEETTSAGSTEGDSEAGSGEDEASRNRRRRRGGRGRRRKADGSSTDSDENDNDSESSDSENDSDSGSHSESEAGADGSEDSGDGDDSGNTKRRRRRRRAGQADDTDSDDPNTVVRVREPRRKNEEFKGSTRLEAKKQRRREGREQGRRRAPILTEAEFLARRESVERVMAIRQQGDRTQIAVLEDGVLVEHYVTRGSATSLVGNVYIGRVQNVLPSMEAAFVDIGKGRNAVLYAGEVNWDAAGLEGQQKRIELALKPGDPVLVQVTKDPVGQKGARLTSQISLPGRFLVYVPDGSMTGISRKLPEGERNRLKDILKRVMPEDAGVIVRTAAEGAPEESLEQDVQRLQALWEDIDQGGKGATPPAMLYAEPDIAIKVVRDIFNEDVTKMIVSGDVAWTTVDAYISAVAPDLLDRLEHWTNPKDIFAELRVDEQLLKALDRKVYLPSGGSLVIDRTEAMTVVDVNTGKFTGQGGNLEQTVTMNNLEAAEEIVRQLRLRDIGGIIVVDFIDMVLESNRDQVLRRLIECLGRDRTKHQVAEVTSLGLVQMTRKRIGSGLIESFSENCEACNGRGIKVSLTSDPHHEPPVRYRRPANAVDPAMVAARALEQAHLEEASHLEAEVIESEASEAEVIESEPVEAVVVESEPVENGEAEAV